MKVSEVLWNYAPYNYLTVAIMIALVLHVIIFCKSVVDKKTHLRIKMNQTNLNPRVFAKDYCELFDQSRK